MTRSLRPYFLLIGSRVNRTEIVPVSFTLNTLIALVAASILAGRDLSAFGRDAALSVLSMLSVALSVYIYNDLTDIEIDRLNKLNRPLASGEVRQSDARRLVTLLGTIGLASALTINLKVFSLALMYFALSVSYSIPAVRLKNKFLLNKLAIGTGTAISYLMGGAVLGEIPVPVFLMAAFGLVATVSGTVVMDFRDIQGDKIYRVKTLPVVWGPVLTIRFLMALVSSMGIATIVGYLQLGFNTAFPILASCVFTAWLFVLYPLFRHWDDPAYVRNTVIKKIAPLGFLVQILTVLGAIL